MSAALKPVLRYPGSKARLAPWIVQHLPPHDSYLEPFCGSLTVLFAKPRSTVETVNDLDAQVVGFFRVLRERPEDLARLVALTPWARAEYEASYDPPTGDALEDARRFAVRSWQAYGMKRGGRSGWSNDFNGLKGQRRIRLWATLPARLLAVAARLREVQIECRPALDLIARFRDPAVAIYADPPYPQALRTDGLYRHDLTVADHDALLDALDAHPGPVLLSGYRCERYDTRLAHWTRLDRAALAEGGRARVESLWLNPVAVARLPARQSTLIESETGS